MRHTGHERSVARHSVRHRRAAGVHHLGEVRRSRVRVASVAVRVRLRHGGGQGDQQAGGECVCVCVLAECQWNMRMAVGAIIVRYVFVRVFG